MSLQELKDKIPDYAKDIRLNLGRVLAGDGSDGLKKEQVASIALASAYATRCHTVISAVMDEVTAILCETAQQSAKAAASIMAMNNVYYRFVHLVSDKEYGKLPANLRMNVIGSPGVDKVDFELMSLAVSAINGCGMCLDAHVQEVIKGGVTRQGVQTSVRIAAVINAAAQAIYIAELS